MKVAVSFLSSRYDMKTTIEKINDCKHANFIHVDIMDGKFVPNKNTNAMFWNNLKEAKKPLDVHLMVKNPLKYIKYLKMYNVRVVYINYSVYFMDDIQKLKKQGFRVGIAINPKDDLNIIFKYLKYVDKVLVMSVNPGLGGQKFLPETLDKIKEINKYRLDNNIIFSIGVDGGINDKTVKKVGKYVDDLVSGSFICKEEDFDKQIKKLINI